jgi:hypothetical protein
VCCPLEEVGNRWLATKTSLRGTPTATPCMTRYCQTAISFPITGRCSGSRTGLSRTERFSKQWAAATTTLYGPQAHPEQRVLNHLLAGLEAASSNYSFIEDWTKKSFGTLTSALDGGAAGSRLLPGLGGEPAGVCHHGHYRNILAGEHVVRLLAEITRR